jgi:hypothetical protein
VVMIGIIPRRCVNLPPGALGALARSIIANRVLEGSALEEFQRRFGEWLGVPHVFGTSTGRSAFQLALEALGLERGREIVFPYVYYPLTIERGRRDDLRRYLLRHGIDSKITDMSDCLALEAFGEVDNMRDKRFGPGEESILEICVYSVISERSIRRLVEVVRTWAQSNL